MIEVVAGDVQVAVAAVFLQSVEGKQAVVNACDQCGDTTDQAQASPEQTGNRGISFGLNNVQICRTDGKRLDGRRPADQDFPDYDDPNAPVDADADMPF